MHTYYANKVRHQLQDVLRMTDANPAFVTAAWVAVLLIGGFAIVDGIVALYRSDEKRAKRDALLWLLMWVPALLLLLAPCN